MNRAGWGCKIVDCVYIFKERGGDVVSQKFKVRILMQVANVLMYTEQGKLILDSEGSD